ncbi:MAG TPA: TatD family hydrolase [Anaerolineales bacterium]
MLTDTHCHLDFNKFDEDRDMVIQRATKAGVDRILVPALELESSKAVIQLANSYPNIFAAVGFHPTDLVGWDDASVDSLRNLISHHNVTPSETMGLALGKGDSSVAKERLPQIDKSKIVAIGEIGLDYYWVREPEKQAQQREVLRQQLQLAQEVILPVVIHMREENDAWHGQASIDLLEILTKWQNALQSQNHPLAKKPGVLHSFNGTLETAQKAIQHNFCIGVTGPVTYKNAVEKRNIIKQIPLERLLIETDAPFLTPVPHRGRRNEPAFVAHITDKIAEIHMTTREHVAKITSANANDLFGWGG